MTLAIAHILSWSRRHRALIALVIAIVVAGSVAGIRQLRFDTDVLSLLPRDGRVIPAFRAFLSSFGSLDQLYVVFTAAPGQSIADYDEDITAWIAALRAAPEILRVDDGTADPSRDFGWLADRQLLLLRGDTLTTALARFTPDGMRTAVAARRELLVVPAPEIAQLVRQDPLGLFDLLRAQMGGTPSGVNIGATTGGYVTSDSQRRLVIAQPSRPPYDAAFSRALSVRVENIRSELAGRPESDPGEEPRAPLTIELTGGHRIAVETESLVRRESISNTVGSLILILPLLFLVFRSFWLVMVGSLPSAISLAVVLGLLGWFGATLSAAATASAAMLFGLGMDGVVLLYVAHTRALNEGATAEAAIDGLSGPSLSMLLGMWTTAATFYGLLFVDFPSLAQLGRLIGHSMLLCGLLTLVLIPATLPRRRGRHAGRDLRMPGLARQVQRYRTTILVAAALVTGALGAAATGLRINPTLDRLRSVTPAALLQERLAQMFGLPADVYVIVDEGSDLEELLSLNDRLINEVARGAPRLSLQGAASLLPPQHVQARRAEIISRSNLSATGVDRALTVAGADAGFQPGAFDPFRARVARLLDAAQRVTFDGYHQHGLGDLLDRFIVRLPQGGWRVASHAFPSTEAEVAALEQTVAAVNPTATVTGLPLVNRELSQRFLPQFGRGLAAGTLVVILIIVLAFRDWWLSLLALLPTVIGMIWAAGALALAGAELDLFALFAVVTFVGIGVDYGIHLVQRYRERGDASDAIAELAPVILVAAGITVLGYGTLIMSSYPPLRSIGMVSAVSVAALAVASLVVLPALLSRKMTDDGFVDGRVI